MVLPSETKIEDYIRDLERTIERQLTEILSLKSEVESLKLDFRIYSD